MRPWRERMDPDQRGPVLFQEGDHAGASEHRGEHDGRDPPSVVGMDIGPVPQEQFRELEMTLEGNSSERGLAAIVPTVHLGPGFQKHPGCLEVSMVAGKQE